MWLIPTQTAPSFHSSTGCAGASGAPNSPSRGGTLPLPRRVRPSHLRRGPPTWAKTSAPRSTVTPRWLPNVDGHPLNPLTSYNRGNPTPPTKASVPQQGIGHPASDLRGQDPGNSPTPERNTHEPPTASLEVDKGSMPPFQTPARCSPCRATCRPGCSAPRRSTPPESVAP